MSKGYGKVQRGILDVIAAEQPDDRGMPQWLTIEDLALHVYQTDEPSPAQREAIRRAANRLADDGQVEVAKKDLLANRYHNADKMATVTRTRPAGTQYYCQKAKGYEECDWCDDGIATETVTDWGKPIGHDDFKVVVHPLPTELTWTEKVAWGTQILTVRQPLTDEQREIEEAARAKMIEEVRAILGGVDPGL